MSGNGRGNEEERVRQVGPLSRRQLLAAGAGAAGVAAGAGLLREGTPALAAQAPHLVSAVVGPAPLAGAYMTVTGVTEGAFLGDKGKPKNVIEVRGLSTNVSTPFDLATGQMSGRRQHQPFTVTKNVGPSSPQLFQAAVNGETLTSVVINLLRAATGAGGAGKEGPYFRITLTNVFISSLSTYSSDTESSHLQAFGLGELEDIDFVFEKITITDLDANSTGIDYWNNAP